MALKKPEEVDESDYMLLYRSPGYHSGGGTKTFDFAHAKTKEEAEALESEGWYRTLPEAYAKVRIAPAVKKDAPLKELTVDDVRASLAKLRDTVNMKAVEKVLKDFGAKAAADLDAGQYADVIAAADVARGGK